MTERLSNTANSYVGAAKQTVGETLGYPGLAADGAAQKSQADNAQKIADAKTNAEGFGNTIHGEAQKTVGSMTNDPVMETEGKANVAKGDLQRKV